MCLLSDALSMTELSSYMISTSVLIKKVKLLLFLLANRYISGGSMRTALGATCITDRDDMN